jgi:hypothetical protein
MKAEPTNISALLGCLGVAQPMIYLPQKDRRGNPYATWDKVTHTGDDKDTAYHIAWLLSGIPSDPPVPSGPDETGIDKGVQIPDSQLAWMIALRAATLFNAIHGEQHQSI